MLRRDILRATHPRMDPIPPVLVSYHRQSVVASQVLNRTIFQESNISSMESILRGEKTKTGKHHIYLSIFTLPVDVRKLLPRSDDRKIIAGLQWENNWRAKHRIVRESNG